MTRVARLEKYTIDELLPEALINIVEAKDKATRKYAYKYILSNPKKAGWLMFMLDYLDKHRAEWEGVTGSERSTRVQRLISEAKKEWRRLSPDKKEEWIQKAKSMISEYTRLAEEELKISKELKELVDKATSKVAELVAEIS